MITGDDFKGAELLLHHFNIARKEPDISLLSNLLHKFSFIPYENATKIIKSDSNPDFYEDFRLPAEVVTDYLKSGTGGTCFSLVNLFKSLLDTCGFQSDLILADRKYGENTHSAIMVNLKGDIYLADPGYLIFTPLLMSREIAVTYRTGFSDILIEPVLKGRFFDVYSLNKDGTKKFRYRLKNEKIKKDIFFEAWRKSFEFEMMNYLVITKASNGEHIYIRDNYVQYGTGNNKIKKHIETREMADITSGLGISGEVIVKALKILGKI